MWSDPEWGQSHEETVPEAEQTLSGDSPMKRQSPRQNRP